MKPTPAEAFTEIVRLFALFAGHPIPHQEEQWPGVEAYVYHLATTGWTRKEICRPPPHRPSRCLRLSHPAFVIEPKLPAIPPHAKSWYQGFAPPPPAPIHP